MAEDQINKMVERFLTWRLPDDFRPDAGISFKADFNEHTAHPMKHKPTGTNLFTAAQATEMVRHMVAGQSQAFAFNFKPCEKNPCVYCNCEGFYPGCHEAPASAEPE
ncbi:hypothetical protein [Mesorhizobium sp. M4B.F.Ca.ET.089.01.1.1]|uniref:hypothetical protein n=1 Tax=Mesorhizobium sp. M4B.F.Ca.ET.089.01.1.1 TaxID=2496662 RepID=UPI00167A9866|nr:hypothetical protein [Mesorhizobium sp. M4B.F.Ca.ET.089.01.1.1]